jgi:hypothetical protein
MRFNEFKIITEGYDKRVEAMQKELKAAGADLGRYGPKKDGIDGMMGPYTRRAAQAFPDIAKNYKEILSKPDSKFASDDEIRAIQDPDFNKKLKRVADSLGIDEADLKAIIRTESNFNPKAQDPNNISAGLIGFTERTARGLGTTKADILNMSAVEQLDYVYKFYKMVGVQPGMDRGTIYMLTFMPAFARSPDNTVLGKRGGGTLILPSGNSSGLSMDKVWSQNPVFGKTRGQDYFTVGDVKKVVNSK